MLMLKFVDHSMIGTGEMIVILVLILILFGPDKIPELARALGKAYVEYRKAVIEAEMGIKRELENRVEEEEKKN